MRTQVVICVLLLATAVAADNMVESMRRGIDSARCGDANEGKTCKELGFENACCSKWGRCGTDAKSCLRENGCQSGNCRSIEPRFVAADPVPVVKAAAEDAAATADDSANIVVKTISNPVPLCKTCAAAKAAESSEASSAAAAAAEASAAAAGLMPESSAAPPPPAGSGPAPNSVNVVNPPPGVSGAPIGVESSESSQAAPAQVAGAPAAAAQVNKPKVDEVEVESAVNKIKEMQLESELKARKLIDEATHAAKVIGEKKKNDYATNKKAKFVLVMMPNAPATSSGKLVAPVTPVS